MNTKRKRLQAAAPLLLAACSLLGCGRVQNGAPLPAPTGSPVVLTLGTDTLTDPRTGITFRSHWEATKNELVPLDLLAEWIGQIRTAFPIDPVFRSLNTVDVWAPGRADCPAGITRFAGLTYPDGRIELNGWAVNPGLVSHEFGHWVALAEQLGDDQDAAGREMWRLYRELRGADFTAATPAAERFAEDFRFVAGADEARGQLNPKDDAPRRPWDVPGLQAFVRQFPIVLAQWRREGGPSWAYYDGPSETWFWHAGRRWERFAGGRLEVQP